MARHVAIVSMFLLSWMTPLSSQEAAQVVGFGTGTLLRIQQQSITDPRVGRLISDRADTLHVDFLTGWTEAIPIDSIVHLEVSLGRDVEQASQNALLAGAAGVAFGALVGFLVTNPNDVGAQYFPGDRRGGAAVGAVLIGIPVGGLAALLALANAPERWHSVALPRRRP